MRNLAYCGPVCHNTYSELARKAERKGIRIRRGLSYINGSWDKVKLYEQGGDIWFGLTDPNVQLVGPRIKVKDMREVLTNARSNTTV